MKSRMVRQASMLRKTLSKKSWRTYQIFLGKVVEGSSLSSCFKQSILGAIRSQDVTALLDIADSLSSQKYEDPTDHFVGNQIAYLIKKYPFPASLCHFDAMEAAKEKFLESEELCARTNRYFNQVHDLDADLQAKFWSMRNFISYVLGPVPSLSSWYESCSFGPGASIGVNGKATNLKRKIASNWSVSPGALTYGFAAFVQSWSLLNCLNDNGREFICLDRNSLWEKYLSNCTVVNYNKIAFVAKTTRTHRTIAVEPLVNGFLQKGIDQLMRLRLGRIGIDLSKQEVNMELARQGSLHDYEGSFSTIDLSSASDSVSIELCRNLLPPDWFELLNSIRSKSFLLDGVVRPYEKFCSMGNGFCFPLETLLFTAACVACGATDPGRQFNVYGDDIIVRQRYAHDVLALLNVMGFQVNTEKTFLEGPFRESCGTDWFEGKDVRPFILDFRFDSLESIFKFLNLSRRSLRTEDFFTEVRSTLLDLIPDILRLHRPRKGPADSGIDSSLDEFMSSRFAAWSKDLQCWSWLELHHRPIEDRYACRWSDYSLMMAALSGAIESKPFVFRRKTSTAVRRVAHG